MGRQDYETETLIAFAHQQGGNIDLHMSEDVGLSLQRSQTQAVCFTAKDHGADASDISPTLRSGSHSGSHANGGVMPAVAIPGACEISPTLCREPGGPASQDWQIHAAAIQGSAVRRLTPVECERLQGFPDNWTLIPYRGKPAADGPRCKALGNSMAVPVMRWIGERIELVNAIKAESLAA